MEGGYIFENDLDFTVKPEDYTFVDAREEEFDHAFGTVSFEQATLAIEKLRETLKTIDGASLKDMQYSLLDFKLTYNQYKRYMYSTASNNQLKRHGLPMRRKVRR